MGIYVKSGGTVAAVATTRGLQGQQGPQGPQGPQGVKGDTGNTSVHELRGTGFPEGVVTAAVGTYYTDTAATNGAIRWVKATGTGNTGWRVVYGDTGWRRIWNGTTSEGLTVTEGDPSGITAGDYRVRRVNDEVWHSLDDLTFTAAAGLMTLTLPAGFKLSSRTVYPGALYCLTHTHTRIDRSGSGGLRSTFSSCRFREHRAYMTDDAWPTTLPGTAA